MIRNVLILFAMLTASAYPQAVSYHSVSSTIDSACAPGVTCPIRAIPGTTVNICSGQGLGTVSTAGTVVTLLSGPSFTGASGNIQINGNQYLIQTVVSSSTLVLFPPGAGTQASATYSTLAGCLSAPITTYTGPSAANACPTTAQLIPLLGGPCASTTDNEGNFNFWSIPGLFYYYLSIPATAGGGVYGPYPLSIGASAGCISGTTCDANYSTLAIGCANAGSGILYVTRPWNGLTTQTLCKMDILPDGKLQTAANATLTMPCPVAGYYQIFDVTTNGGGNVVFTSGCTAPLVWMGTDTSGSSYLGVKALLQGSGPFTTVQVTQGSYLFNLPAASATITSTPGVALACDPGSVINLAESDSSAKTVFTLTGEWNGTNAIDGSCYFAAHTGMSVYSELVKVSGNGIGLNGFTLDGSSTTGSFPFGGIHFPGVNTSRTKISNCHFINSSGGLLYGFNTDIGQHDNIILQNCTSNGTLVEDFNFNGPGILATANGTTSGSSTTVTVASVVGVIAIGQSVLGTGLQPPPTVSSGSGSTWVLSQAVALSSTALEFYTPNSSAAGFTNVKISNITCENDAFDCIDIASYPGGIDDGFSITDVQTKGLTFESIHTEGATNISIKGLKVTGCPTTSPGNTTMNMLAGTDRVSITGSTFDLSSCGSAASAILPTTGGPYPLGGHVTVTGSAFYLGAYGQAFLPFGTGNVFASNTIVCGGSYSMGSFTGANEAAVLVNTVANFVGTGNNFTGCLHGFGRSNPDSVPSQVAATDSTISGNSCTNGGVCIDVTNPGDGLVAANNSANHSIGVIVNAYRNTAPGVPGFAQFSHNLCDDTCANMNTDGTDLGTGITWSPGSTGWYYFAEPTLSGGSLEWAAYDNGTTVEYAAVDYAEQIASNGMQINQRLYSYFNAAIIDQVAVSSFADGSVALFVHVNNVAASPMIQMRSKGSYPQILQTPVASANPSTKVGTTVVQTKTLSLYRDGIANTGGMSEPGLPTSAGSGGLYVCADNTGTFYIKSSCP